MTEGWRQDQLEEWDRTMIYFGAIDRFPILARLGIDQAEIIRLSRLLDALPDNERQQRLRLWAADLSRDNG